MENNDKLIKVYTGTFVAVNILKQNLEEIGVTAMIKNDFRTGKLSGFAGGTPSSIEVYIQKEDQEKADAVLKDFLEKNK